MDDLDRLFRQLVDVLKTTDPQRLTTPFQLSELYQSILPYRTFKKQLGFECNEDYEMAMLRLFAGDSDYATVEPDEVKQQLTLEAQSRNPNPGAFREFAAARVKLNESAVREAQGRTESYAPPPPPPPKTEQPAEEWVKFAPPLDKPTDPGMKAPVFEAVEHSPAEVDVPSSLAPKPKHLGPSCASCNKKLPTSRPVVYCPFCGNQIGPASCPNCGDEIEVGWLFCITCGRTNADR